MQAIWVDLFHARVATLTSEPQNQYNSPTDNNILALKESRTVFECSEKEMRNKLAIWSGYKKIKDTGGWPALIFAEEGGGVYNVCKYRAGGWKEGIFDELEQLREAIELAADTLQPEWRRLVEVLFGSDNGIPERRSWEGQYPHQWVIGLDGIPIPLSDTYRGGLEYELIEASVVDEEAWGDRDPRRAVPGGDEPYLCNICGETQSEEQLGNRCLCYPDLYGGGAGRRGGKYSPVQICRTENKGNGLVARLVSLAGVGKSKCGLFRCQTSGVNSVIRTCFSLLPIQFFSLPSKFMQYILTVRAKCKAHTCWSWGRRVRRYNYQGLAGG